MAPVLFTKGEFVLINAGSYKKRKACVMSVAPKNQWPYRLSVCPIRGENIICIIQARHDQIQQYNP